MQSGGAPGLELRTAALVNVFTLQWSKHTVKWASAVGAGGVSGLMMGGATAGSDCSQKEY